MEPVRWVMSRFANPPANPGLVSDGHNFTPEQSLEFSHWIDCQSGILFEPRIFFQVPLLHCICLIPVSEFLEIKRTIFVSLGNKPRSTYLEALQCCMKSRIDCYYCKEEHYWQRWGQKIRKQHKEFKQEVCNIKNSNEKCVYGKLQFQGFLRPPSPCQQQEQRHAS